MSLSAWQLAVLVVVAFGLGLLSQTSETHCACDKADEE